MILFACCHVFDFAAFSDDVMFVSEISAGFWECEALLSTQFLIVGESPIGVRFSFLQDWESDFDKALHSTFSYLTNTAYRD